MQHAGQALANQVATNQTNLGKPSKVGAVQVGRCRWCRCAAKSVAKAADLVEQLHQDKGVKDNGVVLGGPMDAGGAWHTKQLVPIEDKTIHHS